MKENKVSWIVKDKRFYSKIALIALPVAFQNIISLGVNLMDTVMIGRLGDIPLAATSISNQLFFILQVLIFGVASGSSVLTSQYWGKGDKAMVRHVFSMGHKLAFLLGLIFTLASLFFPSQLLSIFSNDQAVISMGVDYLVIVCLSYLFSALSTCTVMMFRSTGNVNMSVVVSFISLITNVFWNWVLIFGNLGAPELGIVGAAIATLIARVQEFVIVAIYTFVIDKNLSYKLRDLFSKKVTLFRDFVVNVSPIMLNELLWSTGTSMLTVIIGRMSTDFLAANSIVSVVTQIVNVGMIGMSNATAVVVGNEIGAGGRSKVQVMARTVMLLSAGMGLISCGVMHIARPIVLSFYDNLSPQTLEYISILMFLLSFTVVFQTVTITNMMGVLRGGGDSRFVLICDLIFMWLICIPIGFLGAFHLGWSVPLVYMAIKSDEVLKTLICTHRVLGGKWLKDVTR